MNNLFSSKRYMIYYVQFKAIKIKLIVKNVAIEFIAWSSCVHVIYSVSTEKCANLFGCWADLVFAII